MHCDSLFRVEFPSGVQIIEVQYRVEDHEVAADRLAAVDRVVGKQHDVAFLDRHVDYSDTLRDLAAAIEQTGDEQFVLIAEAQRHPRPEFRWRDVERRTPLLLRRQRVLPRTRGRRRSWTFIFGIERGTSLRRVDIVWRSTPCRPAGAASAATAGTCATA